MSKLDDLQEPMTKADPYTAFAGEMMELQNEAARWMAAATPRFMGMSNLAAHPMGAMAAASAIGMGMAGQICGMMAGSMAGAMSATSMLANETTGGLSAPFGVSNPMNFDLASGTFDDEPSDDAKTRSSPDAAEASPAQPASNAVKSEAEPVAIDAEAEEALARTSVAPIMPEDFVKPKSTDKPDMPDDLKAISGIGPKLEAVLNSLGVWTYAQIADWTPNEVAWVDDYLQFKGRIERDDWIAQAAELAKKAK